MSTRPNSLTLVTHNAYWFQGAPSLWGQERTRAHPDAVPLLTRLYDALDMDILCLQEVPAPEVLEMLRAELGMEGVYFPGGKRPAYGGAILWQGLAGSVVDFTNTAERVFERFCLKLDTRIGDRSLDLVAIHLASNRYAPARRGEPLHLAELATLFAACPAPDMVVGDFNATPDSAVYAQMVERGFVDCGQGYAEHGRPAERRIDYIWIRTGAGLSVAEYEVIRDQRFSYDADAGIFLSDHHPVCVRLRLDQP